MNHKFGVEELVMDYSNVPSWHLTGWTEEKYAKPVRIANVYDYVSHQASLNIHCVTGSQCTRIYTPLINKFMVYYLIKAGCISLFLVYFSGLRLAAPSKV
jgi:hypothetical protein